MRIVHICYYNQQDENLYVLKYLNIAIIFDNELAREFLNYREIWLWILALTHPGHDSRRVALSSFCIYFPHLEEGFYCLMGKSRNIPWLKASSIPQTFSNHWLPSLLQTIVLVIHRWLTYSVSKRICLFCSSCQSQEDFWKVSQCAEWNYTVFGRESQT